jgi:predicted enzyme related to lactoylglutathione lyase
MNKKFLGLRTAIYQVPDVAEAKNWYSKITGVKPYFDEPFYVGFNVGGFELGLVPQEGRTNQNTGGVTAYWGVTDVRKTFDELIAAGASSFEDPHDVGGDIVVATVKDPWGNLFGIIFNPNFKPE